MAQLPDWLQRMLLGATKLRQITDLYVECGVIFGSVVRDLYKGVPVNLNVLLQQWIDNEQRVYDLGYITLSLLEFTNATTPEQKLALKNRMVVRTGVAVLYGSMWKATRTFFKDLPGLLEIVLADGNKFIGTWFDANTQTVVPITLRQDPHYPTGAGSPVAPALDLDPASPQRFAADTAPPLPTGGGL